MTRIQRPGVDARLVRRVNAEFGSPDVAEFSGLGSFIKKIKKAVSIKNVVKVAKAAVPVVVAGVATGGIGVGAALASKAIKSAAVQVAKNAAVGAITGNSAPKSGTTSSSRCGMFDIKCKLAQRVAAAAMAPASQQAATSAAADLRVMAPAPTSPEAAANALTADYAPEAGNVYAPRAGAGGFAISPAMLALGAVGLFLVLRKR